MLTEVATECARLGYVLGADAAADALTRLGNAPSAAATPLYGTGQGLRSHV